MANSELKPCFGPGNAEYKTVYIDTQLGALKAKAMMNSPDWFINWQSASAIQFYRQKKRTEAKMRKITELLFINAVGTDGNLTNFGPSHIIASIGDNAKPNVFCGVDTKELNWTGNSAPRTSVCNECESKRTEAKANAN